MNLKNFYRYVFIFLLSVFVFTGCGSDNGGGAFVKTSSNIKLLSPQAKSTVDYNYVTLEVKDNVADVKAKVNGTEYIGVKNKSSFLIYNVALKKGKNIIELIADKGSEELNVTISSEGKGYAPIGINADKREGFEKLDTTLTVQTKLSVSKYLLDKDNDGVIDDDKTNNSFTLKYIKEGRYFPTATVKTSDGIWYSTQQNISLDVKAKPTEVKINGISEQINDLERFGGYIWALSNSNIYKIDENNESKITTINLSGVSSPQGFCYDDELNLYIADSGNNRVVKLLASSNYQPDTYISQDGSFGTQGSGKGEFENPVDCMVDSEKGNEKIFVVDNGNNRIQVFNRAGVYMSEFDGNTTIEGKFNNPTGILSSSITPTIVDSGNNLIRIFYQDGIKKRTFGKNDFVTPLKISNSSKGYIITDSGNNRLVVTNVLGDIVNIISFDKTPQSAIYISEENEKVFTVISGESGLNIFSTNSDPIKSTPVDIVKKFVQFVLNDDKLALKSMVDIYDSNDKIINRIYSDKALYDVLINHLKIIDEYISVSKDSRFAQVLITFKNTNDELPVTLIKQNGSWHIKNFY